MPKAKSIRRHPAKERALYHSIGRTAPTFGEIIEFIFKLGALVMLATGIAMAVAK